MAKVANDTVIGETIAEIRSLAQRGRFWAALLGTGVVVGLAGPFGTYQDWSIPVRLGYWMLIVTTTFWLGYVVSFYVASRAESMGFGALPSVAFGAIAASIPVTVWLAAFHATVFPTSFWSEAVQLVPYVVIICLTVAAITEFIATEEVSPTALPISTPAPDWLDQLPPHLGKDLISLQAQDHYVTAETELGSTMIRTTLSEAARGLGDYGMRLHRSWWVARRAVKAYRYSKGAPVVVLQDGRELPVGRTYRRAVRDWLR